ncbi:MAG: discoidin domain-containing protein, partial [Planctomycetes bacterium]|nr:discoidin domain-containing protein [Planctomycetota bacterium]
MSAPRSSQAISSQARRALAAIAVSLLAAGASVLAPGAATAAGDPPAIRTKVRSQPEEIPALRGLIEADWIDEDRRFAAERQRGEAAPAETGAPASPAVNAQGVTTRQDASGGCDGIKNGRWGFHTASGEEDPWWQVDLGEVTEIDRVVVYNRTDGGTAPRTRHLQILGARDGQVADFALLYQHDGTT